MKVSAKCMNHSGCLKAYRGEIIELDPGAPLVCPECGKPLAKAGGGAGGIVKIAAILVAVLVVAVGVVVGMKVVKKKGGGTEPGPTPSGEVAETPSTTSPSTTSTTNEPSTSPTTSPTTSVTPPTATPAQAETSPNVAPPSEPKITSEAASDQVRQDVLNRVDKIPNLSAEKKDRLYVSVQRARDMRKIIEIPFASGQVQMPTVSGPQVKKLLDDPAIVKFRDDLTAVFVVLGFADSKGDEKTNFAISEKRAKSVVDYLEKQCQIRNVTHAVPMGGTNLVDKNNAAKNRVAEIWAVLP
jgi:outer membrane protein OmpA-like peptidoglycan-associated protein